MWICRLSLSEARLYHVLGFSLQGSLEAVKRMRNSRELLGNFWVRYEAVIKQLMWKQQIGVEREL